MRHGTNEILSPERKSISDFCQRHSVLPRDRTVLHALDVLHKVPPLYIRIVEAPRRRYSVVEHVLFLTNTIVLGKKVIDRVVVSKEKIIIRIAKLHFVHEYFFYAPPNGVGCSRLKTSFRSTSTTMNYSMYPIKGDRIQSGAVTTILSTRIFEY